MKKRIFAALLALAMALALLPGTALADDYDVWVQGTRVNDNQRGQRAGRRHGVL